MSRIAKEIRSEQLQRFRKMSPSERVALAQRLGVEGMASFMAANGMTRLEAQRAIRRSRRIGRRPSRCMDGR